MRPVVRIGRGFSGLSSPIVAEREALSPLTPGDVSSHPDTHLCSLGSNALWQGSWTKGRKAPPNKPYYFKENDEIGRLTSGTIPMHAPIRRACRMPACGAGTRLVASG